MDAARQQAIPDLSVVVPVYNEVENVAALCREIDAALADLPQTAEVILVDDGSSDGSWDALREAAEAMTVEAILVRLRRNFGQTAAMSAGFHQARAEVIVTLDADLQNDPRDIPRLLEKLEESVDVVSGWRRRRKDPFLSRRLPSMIANGLISKITGVSLHDYGCTLKVYRREVIENVQLYGEMHRFIPALANWVGGAVAEVEVSHRPRRAGTSKYGIGRTFRVILDLITVKFLLRYSMGPMQIFGKIGALFLAPGILLLGLLILFHLSFRLFGTEFGADLIKRPFWIMSSFLLVFLGMQFISMGLLAEVQTRTYHESQNKKTYVIREVLRNGTSSS
jgi:glycosyltransferase involved in cell wall biosynthesis